VKNSVFPSLTLALAIGSVACSLDGNKATSSSGEPRPTSSSNAAGTPDGSGTVGAQLTLPAGQLIEVVQWVITGPNNATTVVQSGSVSIPSTNAVSFLASDIPAGAGYRIALSGTAIDGSVTCTGSASFAIQSHVTTPVPVAMACSVVTSGSQVTLVDGTSFNCANVTNVTAIPAETTIGGTISLTSSAAGPVPSALSYAWSAPSGTFDHPTSATPKFTCTVAGPVPLVLVVADGPVPAGDACNAAASTRTVTILCDALQQDAGTDSGTPPDAGADSGGSPDAGTDAGESTDAGDGGISPPPVPALPQSGILGLGIAMLAAGGLRTRRPNRRSL
jgi:hypothetical protein